MAFTLYNLTEGAQKILQIIEDGDDPALWQDQLNEIKEETKEKIINCGYVYKNLVAEAAVCAEEAKKLAVRAKAIDNKAERLRLYVEDSMRFMQIDEVKAPTFIAKFRNLPAKVDDAINMAELPSIYKRHIPETWEPEKALILADLKKGKEIPGVQLATSRTKLEFK